MDLVNRLKFFLESQKIAISQFADTCRIPRPTMSQILNGRNKKVSDELITKIHEAYPTLSVLWLMFGEGSMLINENIQISEAKNEVNQPSEQTQLSEEQNNTQYLDQPSDSLNFDQNSFNTIESTQYIDSNREEMSKQIQSNNFVSEFEDPIPYKSSGSGTQQSNLTIPGASINFDIDNSKDQYTPSYTPASTSAAASKTLPNYNSDKKQSYQENSGESISLRTTAGKKITNIVVFYSDNSFQSFTPETSIIQ